MKLAALFVAAMTVTAATAQAGEPPMTDEEITARCKQLGEGIAPEAAKEAWDQCWAGYAYIRDGQRRSDARQAAIKAENERVDRERAARAAIATERAEDPAWFVPSYSAVICEARDEQRTAKAEIAEQRGVARRSGGWVLNTAEIDTLQFVFRRAEQRERAARANLKARGKAPLACSSAKVQPITACMGFVGMSIPAGEGYDACRGPIVEGFLDVLGVL